ncbi:MAG: dockerin type I repeat-containing protein [Clostridia bacterium]|nr:dockerin type I repeat-containing protein [Clostridia bacterium]
MKKYISTIVLIAVLAAMIAPLGSGNISASVTDAQSNNIEYPTDIIRYYYKYLSYEYDGDDDVFGKAPDAEAAVEAESPKNRVLRWDKNPSSGIALLTTARDDGAVTYETKSGGYTMEFYVRVTDTKPFLEGENSALINLFAGDGSKCFSCGYDFDAEEFFVKDMSDGSILEAAQGDFTLNEWHHVVFQYYKENCEMRYYFDPMLEGARVAFYEKPLFKISRKDFTTSYDADAPINLARVNCQVVLDNVKFYNFVDWETFPYPAGDVNDDRTVDMKDVLAVKRIIALLDEPTLRLAALCDVNRDDDVNMKDVLFIVKKILEK